MGTSADSTTAFQSLQGTIRRLVKLSTVAIVLRFQSLQGTIRRNLEKFGVSMSNVFQSLQGTIRSSPPCLLPILASNFNLSKVQLEAPLRYSSTFNLAEFQSLQGTIRRPCYENTLVVLTKFQSLQGTIRRIVSIRWKTH